MRKKLLLTTALALILALPINVSAKNISNQNKNLLASQHMQLTDDSTLIDNNISDNDINYASDINYTSEISSEDLKIDSYKMYRKDDKVEFFITYESGTDRYVRLFDSPDGDVFMKTSSDKLSTGTNSLKFSLTTEQYDSVKEIVLKFYTDDTERNFIHFNTNQGSSTLIDNSIPDEDINYAADITYNSDIYANDFKIDSYKMYRKDDKVEFFLTYESGIDRYVRFFNPPEGDKFFKVSTDKLKAGTNTLKISLTAEQYDSVSEITAMFYSDNNDRNFIYFKTKGQK